MNAEEGLIRGLLYMGPGEAKGQGPKVIIYLAAINGPRVKFYRLGDRISPIPTRGVAVLLDTDGPIPMAASDLSGLLPILAGADYTHKWVKDISSDDASGSVKNLANRLAIIVVTTDRRKEEWWRLKEAAAGLQKSPHRARAANRGEAG